MGRPRILFHNDGRRPLIYYHEPPMQKEEYEAPVDELLRKINQMYKMTAPRSRVFGYWFVWDLDRQHWPKQGTNTVEVTLLKRDPEVTPELAVRDVELDVKCLMGQNFFRGFSDPDLGPYRRTS